MYSLESRIIRMLDANLFRVWNDLQLTAVNGPISVMDRRDL
jgi:hypothetical protein